MQKVDFQKIVNILSKPVLTSPQVNAFFDTKIAYLKNAFLLFPATSINIFVLWLFSLSLSTRFFYVGFEQSLDFFEYYMVFLITLVSALFPNLLTDVIRQKFKLSSTKSLISVLFSSLYISTVLFILGKVILDYENFFFFTPIAFLLFLVLVTLAIIVFGLVVISHNSPEEHLYNFLNHLGAKTLVFPIFYSLILGLGIFVAFRSIGYLFEIPQFTEIDYFYVPSTFLKLEIYIYLTVLFLVGGFSFLANFPAVSQNDLPSTGPSASAKATGALADYIMGPLVTLYSVIVYAYILMVLFTWKIDFDEGVIYTNLILLLLITSNWLTNVTLQLSPKTIFNKFMSKYSFHILLLPTIYLLILFTKRILDHGFTINRYLILALMIYLVIAAIYMIFSKGKKLSVLVVFLAVFFFVGLFTPANIFSVCSYSQSKMIKTMLIEEKIIDLETGYLDKEKLLQNGYTSDQIRDKVFYLQRWHGFDQLHKELPYQSIYEMTKFPGVVF